MPEIATPDTPASSTSCMTGGSHHHSLGLKLMDTINSTRGREETYFTGWGANVAVKPCKVNSGGDGTWQSCQMATPGHVLVTNAHREREVPKCASSKK